MDHTPKPEARSLEIAKRLKTISRVFGISAIIVGSLVLFGWHFNLEVLKRVNTGAVAMNPATAICFILSGIALLLFQEKYKHNKTAKIIAYSCAGFILFVGLIKLVSIFTLLHIPVDELLFTNKLQSAEEQLHLPNRMAPNTACNFVLTGLAFLLLDADPRRSSRHSQLLVIIVVLIALLSLYGYIYGVRSLYGIMAFIPMAVHTAFGFLVMAIGILFARPHRGAIALIIEGGSLEVLFIEIMALIVPLVFGWLQLKGQQAGYYSPEFGTAIFVILTYIISFIFLGRSTWLQHLLLKEKELTEAVMMEHSQQLQSILDNTGTPIVIKDLKGRYILVNKQFEKLFHISSEQIKGKTSFDIFKEEVAEIKANMDTEVFESGQPQQVEEIYPVDGQPRTFVTEKFPLRDTNGNMYALCGISTDITYRKELENTLRSNEQQVRAILQSLGEGVVVSDLNGNFLHFNSLAEEILGMGATEGSMHEWSHKYGLFLPDGVTRFPPEEIPLTKALKGQATDEVEMFVRNPTFPDGKQISITGRPVLNDKGEVSAGVVVFRDITQRKKLEQLIYENEKRLRIVLSNIGEGIAVADINGRFLLFNKKAEVILGIGAIHGQLHNLSSIYGIYEPDGITPFPIENIPLVRALKGEATDQVEMFIKNEKIPEGKTIMASGRPILDDKGNITAGIVDFRDITELKNLENILAQIQEKYKYAVDFRRRNPGS